MPRTLKQAKTRKKNRVVRVRPGTKKPIARATKLVSQLRPGQAAPGKGPTPPQKKVRFKKGYGSPDDAADIKIRHQQFIRQQRENKVKVRSLVRRDPATGRQTMRRVTFKRGVPVAKGRLKTFADHEQLEVITNARGQRMERKVSSSWVDMIHLVMWNKSPALAITFRDGFSCVYPTTNIRDYEAMSRSASKGKYVWAALYHGRPGHGAPYIEIGF